jgi:hypothetical protein
MTGPFLLVAREQVGGSIQGRKVWGLTILTFNFYSHLANAKLRKMQAKTNIF